MSPGCHIALDINHLDEMLPLAKPSGRLRVASYAMRMRYHLELGHLYDNAALCHPDDVKKFKP